MKIKNELYIRLYNIVTVCFSQSSKPDSLVAPGLLPPFSGWRGVTTVAAAGRTVAPAAAVDEQSEVLVASATAKDGRLGRWIGEPAKQLRIC